MNILQYKIKFPKSSPFRFKLISLTFYFLLNSVFIHYIILLTAINNTSGT